MNSESIPQRIGSIRINLGDSFFGLTPIKAKEFSQRQFVNSVSVGDNKVGHKSLQRKNVTHLQDNVEYPLGKNKMCHKNSEHTYVNKLNSSIGGNGEKRKNDEVIIDNKESSRKRKSFQSDNHYIQNAIQETDAANAFGNHTINVGDDIIKKINDNGTASNNLLKQKEDKVSFVIGGRENNNLFVNDSVLNASAINMLDEIPKNAVSRPTDNPEENITENSFDSMNFNNSILQRIELSSTKLLNSNINSDQTAENSNSKKVYSTLGLTGLFKDSDIINWNDSSLIPADNDESLCEPKFSNEIRNKLMNNASNINASKLKASGWTQINGLADSWLMSNMFNSQYHEIGPFYGLPLKVKKLIEEHKGIKELYPWQDECLNLPAIKQRRNLVYALPTNGGKTLVAEILILRELLCYKKNVLFILPFVAIVQEKVRALSQLALDLGFLVEEYAAGKGVVPPRKRRRRNSVLIATIEKGLTVVHSLLESKRLHEFGLIVVDELHLISEDSGRGACLETLLTHVLHSQEKIHIIGMTATIGNLDEVAKFLNADSYSGSFRPVKLSEFVKCGKSVFAVNWQAHDSLKHERNVLSPVPSTDPDGIGQLVQEVMPNDSVLVFCATKRNCENVSLLLCQVLSRDLTQHKGKERMSFYRALTSESNGQVCPILKKTIPYGVAYHHSGLTADERKLIEEAFKAGTLSVICCTSTLAAGVNLPARRVILRSPYVGKDFITLSKYKQMIGRAGRAGLGSDGESYLICQPADCEKVKQLLQSKMDESNSKMDSESCKSLVLSAIGLGVATTRSSLRTLMNKTLLHVQAEKFKIDTKEMTDLCIRDLYKQKAIKTGPAQHPETENDEGCSKLNVSPVKSGKHVKSLKITNDCELAVSRLGKAAMKGGMSMPNAQQLYKDLLLAEECLVLISDLHLLYLVTPYDSVDQIKTNYSVYFDVCMQLSDNELITAKKIGLSEYAISKLVSGVKPKNLSDLVVNRFYVTLIINELWKKQGVWEVAQLFQIPRGAVQNVMSQASSFAQNVLRFCDEFEELWAFKALLSDFAPRLAHCCSAELLPLMELPAVKQGRAKQLYNAGFKTLQILATSKPSDLVQSVDHMPSRVATQIIAAAKMLLLEKAENLQEEAEDVLDGLVEKVLGNEI